jgi:hypothetical protein
MQTSSNKVPLKSSSPYFHHILAITTKAAALFQELQNQPNPASKEQEELKQLLSKFDLTTKVWYVQGSAFPYLRETVPPTSPDFLPTIAENLAFLMVRSAGVDDVLVLSRLDAALLKRALQELYVNNFDAPNLKRFIIRAFSQEHDAELWAKIDRIINQI